ncbi:MAG: TRAP transporter substrate-binding protein DctP [Fidelibacterota bacterium]|nr:MAG: TRAP transporter substrate-binding protein DctP [Candidatus Neomarinimicrobiota bacterium]
MLRHLCKLATVLILLVTGSSLSAASAAKPIVIKLATLAPVGSPWYDLLLEVAHEWQEITDNQVVVKMYPGGVAGDESDLVIKMRLNHIQAAAMTAAGMSEIDRGVWAYSLPLMIQEFNQLDWLRAQVSDVLEQRFEEAGFVVLAWADVGWTYWFSKQPIYTPDDLRKQRIFTWSDGPNIEGLWKSGGFHSVSLAATDILPGLQTGLIDAMATSPITAATFQWFGIAKNMCPLRWGVMTGGILINKQTWEQIPEELRPTLAAVAKRQEVKMMSDIRYMGDEAIRVMQGYGLQVLDLTPEHFKAWESFIKPQWTHLRGLLIDTTMYDWVMELYQDLPPPDASAPIPISE